MVTVTVKPLYHYYLQSADSLIFFDFFLNSTKRLIISCLCIFEFSLNFYSFFSLFLFYLLSIFAAELQFIKLT